MNRVARLVLFAIVVVAILKGCARREDPPPDLYVGVGAALGAPVVRKPCSPPARYVNNTCTTERTWSP